MLELKAQIVERDSIIRDMERKLEDKGKDITRANNRVGDMRKLIVRYNESLFFKSWRGWLWLRDKFQHKVLSKILNNSKD